MSHEAVSHTCEVFKYHEWVTIYPKYYAETMLYFSLTTFVASGGQVPKATLRLASNLTPARWNHPRGQQFPQPSHQSLP